jgi:chorismate-pyruvate lyase
MTGDAQSTAVELEVALQRTTGTVTELLEDLAGEPIDADILAQDTVSAGDDNPLGLVSDAQMIRRAVLLTGRTSGRTFVYAESAIARERLPDPVRRRLESSREPIGRVFADHRLTVQRVPVAGPVVAVGNAARPTDLPDRSVLSRRYRITFAGEPAIVVSEWFLETVLEALACRSEERSGSR